MPNPTPLTYDDDETPALEALDHGPLQDFVGMYLRVAYEAAYQDFRRRLGDETLRPGYFTILTLIVRNPRITQTQIATASRRDKSNVTNAVYWMEREGLITRHLSRRDRRSHMCVATPAGIALQRRMETRAMAHLQALDQAIGPMRRADFIATLKEMAEALEWREDQ